MDPSTFATLASVGLNLFGANKAQSAARDSAQSNIEASKIAAEAAKFKPYSISTGFGTSFFDENKQEAGYTLDPTLQAFRNAMYGGSGEFMGQIQTDPTAAAQQYYNQQQGLMAGGRGAEDIALRNQQLQSGRIGLGLSGASQGAGAGTGYVNPEQYQRDLARAQQDQALAASSTQMAQADIDRAISRGTGLLQTGLGIEEYGLKPLQIGADIGNRQATAGANQGNILLAGGQAAANANLAGGLAGAGMFGNLGTSLMKQNFNPQTGQPIR
jgi:hypothetical protein